DELFSLLDHTSLFPGHRVLPPPAKSVTYVPGLFRYPCARFGPGSIQNGEFDLQMDGYGAALRNLANQSLIINGGGIAINSVFFGTSATTASAWTHLFDVTSINAYATTLETLSRPFSGRTNIAAGMESSLNSFALTDFTASRNVMDVSGDGEQNENGSPSTVRNTAAAQGIIINGLPIGPASLQTYYQNDVVTVNGFLEPAAGFPDFTDAINKKLFRELGGVPEPSTYAMMASGLVALAYFRRKK
ncbi:MAG: DUF1194 domain-containing protein, partial [Acidobacteria bacterium]|nr:DUF1194 domain-containing protein [Acidobacteriota bacterium]